MSYHLIRHSQRHDTVKEGTTLIQLHNEDKRACQHALACDAEIQYPQYILTGYSAPIMMFHIQAKLSNFRD